MCRDTGYTCCTCILCVKDIAGWQRELQQPSTEEWKKREIQHRIQKVMGWIQEYNTSIAFYNTELAVLEIKMTISEGEPSGLL